MWSEMQEFKAPEVNSDLVGFNTEMLAEYHDMMEGNLQIGTIEKWSV